MTRKKHSQHPQSSSAFAQPANGQTPLTPSQIHKTVYNTTNTKKTPLNSQAYAESNDTAVISGSARRRSKLRKQQSSNDGELTFGERLAQLQEQQASKKTISTSIQHPKTGSTQQLAARTATAVTLTNQLIQALHTSDSVLLEGCLDNSDVRIVRGTVKRLPEDWVLPFIEALVERLGKGRRGAGDGKGASSTDQARNVVVWLRAAILAHVGYLVAVPFLSERLADLYSILEGRMELHQKILSLNGRLEVVVAHINYNIDPENSNNSKNTSSSIPISSNTTTANEYREQVENTVAEAELARKKLRERSGTKMEKSLVNGEKKKSRRKTDEDAMDEDDEDEEDEEDEESDEEGSNDETMVNGAPKLDEESSDEDGEDVNSDDEMVTPNGIAESSANEDDEEE